MRSLLKYLRLEVFIRGISQDLERMIFTGRDSVFRPKPPASSIRNRSFGPRPDVYRIQFSITRYPAFSIFVCIAVLGAYISLPICALS